MSERDDLAEDCERRARAIEGWIETGQVPDGGGNQAVIRTLREAAVELRRLRANQRYEIARTYDEWGNETIHEMGQ